ncbi:hypothetical protein ACA910_014902 [Epithemia clementina (nom. ined.)]
MITIGDSTCETTKSILAAVMQAPNKHNSRNDIASSSPSPRPTISSSGVANHLLPDVVQRRSNDVLLGRGNVRWEGNQRFQTVIRQNSQRYNDAESRALKTRIVFEIVGIVRAWGGRFLHPIISHRSKSAMAKAEAPSAASASKKERKIKGKTSGIQWTLANNFQIRKKIGQAFRYQLAEQTKSEKTMSFLEAAELDRSSEAKLKTEQSADKAEFDQSPDAATNAGDSSGFKRKRSLQNEVPDLNMSSATLEITPVGSRTSRLTRYNTAESSSSSSATYIEDEEEEDSDDRRDSVGSLDISVLMDLLDSDSDHSRESNNNKSKKPKQPPLLSNHEILSSLGYDADEIFNKETHHADCPKNSCALAVISKASNKRADGNQGIESHRGHSGTSHNHDMNSEGSSLGTGPNPAMCASETFAADTSCNSSHDNDSKSSGSIDVSLTAILHVEREEEEWERAFFGGSNDCNIYQDPLLTDAEILSFLGYTAADPTPAADGPNHGNFATTSNTTSSAAAARQENYCDSSNKTMHSSKLWFEP